MRVIGHLPDEASAATFSDFLYVQGITNQVEADAGRWAVWIHADEHLEKAKDWLAHFRGHPGDPRFRKESAQARALREREAADQDAAGRRFFDRKQVFRSTTPYGIGPLTFGLVLACVVVAGLRFGWSDEQVLRALRISNYFKQVLPEVLGGEVWRLFTPTLLHFGVLHLLFNMMWLFDLGAMIEGRQGTRRLALLVVVIAGLSNLGQYYASGPNFGGMSGVVYGLLGYIWMKGKFDPASGLNLHPQTVAMMLIWFVLCLTGWIGQIANTAHGVGLVVGMAWGILAGHPRFRKRLG